MDSILFRGRSALVRIVTVGMLAYLLLLLLLRVSRTHTLFKTNAFNLMVTVAIGLALATVLLLRDTPLIEGVLAFALLIGLQFVVTWTTVRAPAVNHLVQTEPTMLPYRGNPVQDAMRRQQITRSELLRAARDASVSALQEIEAIVLETDGSFSIVKRKSPKARSAPIVIDCPQNSAS